MDDGSFVQPRRAEPTEGSLDLDQLLHPAQAFGHPDDVVNDLDLTVSEKRAILSSWASDACAVDSMPSLRRRPGSARLVTFDDILDALKALDAGDGAGESHAIRRKLRKLRLGRLAVSRRRSRPGNEGSELGA
jgi:hypothetical protein